MNTKSIMSKLLLCSSTREHMHSIRPTGARGNGDGDPYAHEGKLRSKEAMEKTWDNICLRNKFWAELVVGRGLTAEGNELIGRGRTARRRAAPSTPPPLGAAEEEGGCCFFLLTVKTPEAKLGQGQLEFDRTQAQSITVPRPDEGENDFSSSSRSGGGRRGTMLGFACASRFRPPIPQVPSPPLATARRNLAFPSSLFRAPASTHENPSRFAVFAGDGDVRNQEPGSVERRENGPDGGAGGDGDGDGDVNNERRRPPVFNLRLGGSAGPGPGQHPGGGADGSAGVGERAGAVAALLHLGRHPGGRPQVLLHRRAAACHPHHPSVTRASEQNSSVVQGRTVHHTFSLLDLFACVTTGSLCKSRFGCLSQRGGQRNWAGVLPLDDRAKLCAMANRSSYIHR
ncbi:hypothetical protein NL676_004146 [Syzygium grande]|nr:hypothetical protein NL676_004146 [Syzygium grande]